MEDTMKNTKNKAILSLLIAGIAATTPVHVHAGWLSDFCDSDLSFTQKALKKAKKTVKREYKVWKKYLPNQVRGILIGSAATLLAGLVIKHIIKKPYNIVTTFFYKLRVNMLMNKITNKINSLPENHLSKENKDKLRKVIKSYKDLTLEEDIDKKTLIAISKAIRKANKYIDDIVEKTNKSK